MNSIKHTLRILALDMEVLWLKICFAIENNERGDAASDVVIPKESVDPVDVEPETLAKILLMERKGDV